MEGEEEAEEAGVSEEGVAEGRRGERMHRMKQPAVDTGRERRTGFD